MRTFGVLFGCCFEGRGEVRSVAVVLVSWLGLFVLYNTRVLWGGGVWKKKRSGDDVGVGLGLGLGGRVPYVTNPPSFFFYLASLAKCPSHVYLSYRNSISTATRYYIFRASPPTTKPASPQK